MALDGRLSRACIESRPVLFDRPGSNLVCVRGMILPRVLHRVWVVVRLVPPLIVLRQMSIRLAPADKGVLVV